MVDGRIPSAGSKTYVTPRRRYDNTQKKGAPKIV